MTNNQLTENSVNQLLNSVRLARDNAERDDNRVDHSFYYALTIALEELQERRKAEMGSEPVAWLVGEAVLFNPDTVEAYAKRSELPVMPLYAHPPINQQEPVAWDYEWASCITCEGPQNFNRVIEREAPPEWAINEGQARNIIPLYRHAQPAPVVMDDEKLRALFDAWFASDCSFDQSPEASEADNIAWRESYWYVWQRCRAAMFQAGNSPAIPGAWIPVIERMPEFGDYLVTDGTDFDVQLFNGEEFIPGFIWEDKITHWMPLPSAPQEVNPWSSHYLPVTRGDAVGCPFNREEEP
ncbi:DUF551 domain-containing protein [Klebsiella aerogenes]|uniref:DUF551 domain-containing protein n=1 Tax=Klebsiella aerogenes TaxID=548 RepID=UPI00389B1EBF